MKILPEIKYLQLIDLHNNPENPRRITENKFNKLVQSIRDFPEMLQARPLIIDENYMILGGNMRLKACFEAGLTEVPTIQLLNLTKEQKKELIIKDNVAFGEWDWDIIVNQWETPLLTKWGLDLPVEWHIPKELPKPAPEKTSWTLTIETDNSVDLDKIIEILDESGIKFKIKK